LLQGAIKENSLLAHLAECQKQDSSRVEQQAELDSAALEGLRSEVAGQRQLCQDVKSFA
jgi:hypothetical protein